MTTDTPIEAGGLEKFREEFAECWRLMPEKGLFGLLLVSWLALFQFFGNSTLGYVNTPSFFRWLEWMYANRADDEHGRLIPFVVLALFWVKRQELLTVPKRNWWPALLLLLLALALQVFSFMVQQTQISVVAFFVGLYALTGLVWGWQWMRASFFPFFLFAFCLPLGNLAEPITFPLRVLATQLTVAISDIGLGINVIRNGTDILEPSGKFKYDVAVACSGIRSLTAIFAMSTIYAFLAFKSPWKRLVMMAAAFPLAIAGNSVRLIAIIIAAEAFGQAAGNYVHNNGVLSMLPYVPAIFGIVLLGRLLKEKKPAAQVVEPLPPIGAAQNL